MSYISKKKQEIKKDIIRCEYLIQKGYVTNSDYDDIVGKYLLIDKDFETGLHDYMYVAGAKAPNEIQNVKIIKSKLEMLLIEIENPQLYNNGNNGINVNNNIVNNNKNEVNVELSIDEIKRKIEDNTYISDKEKAELSKVLEQINELQKSKESKNKKWDIAKGILKFLADKGADIAIMFLPQILKVLS